MVAADCAESQSCLCSQVNGRILLRSTTQLVQDEQLTLIVDELVNVQTDEWVEVQVGEQVGGNWMGKMVCSETPLSLDPGTKVLEYPDYPEYKACLEGMYGPTADGEGDQTRPDQTRPDQVRRMGYIRWYVH